MRKYGLNAATALVIANMVGVGVFTSLGFQLLDITDYRSILLLWVIGGAVALMGSYCYSELSAAFPGSGGEYHFLQISFGRFVGFLSGAVSATVGFSAPVAAAAFAFSAYLDNVVRLPFSPSVTGSMLVLLITIVHILKKNIGSAFQVLMTSGKVLLLVLLIFSGIWIRFFGSEAIGAKYLSEGSFPKDLFSGGFWVSLIFVSYAYSGWNATAYIINEVENARRNVPRSILTGTILVLVLYTAIHFTFLVAAPAADMKGQQDVAYVAAYHLIGKGGASLIALLIAFFLISTISSMIVVGPRVLQRLAKDHEALRFFSAFNRNDVPARAILLQSAIAILILLTSQFQWIVTSIGFVLLLFNTLTVISLFILRVRHPEVERSIRVPFYPFLPFLFILFNGWIMVYLAVFRTQEVLHGLLILAGCALLYLYMWFRQKHTRIAAGMVAGFICVMLFSCDQPVPQPGKAKDDSKVSGKVKPDSSRSFKADRLLEEKAAILTGEDTGILSPPARLHATKIRKEWLTTEKKVLQPVSNWAYNEVPVSLSQNALVFYPFSGPDFAFANAIYPGADTYVLAGLEPVGDPTDAFDTSHIGTRGHLIQLSRILYYSNRFGFFRTKDMARQLKKIGVFNILLFYLKNSGYDIGRMRLLTWDASRRDTIFRGNATPTVCYIEFSNPTSGAVSHLFYFSRDLSDRSFKKDSSWLTWVERKASGRSMLSLTKSASYLMHGHSFTRVRDFLLAHSRLHIQDDTGIPYRYLAGSERKNILFGEYERPIPMFSRRYQSDLRAAYDSISTKPLPFRIGYTAVYGKSNIQLSFLK